MKTKEITDLFHIAFYVGTKGEEDTLVVLKNKKVINTLTGVKARKAYELLLEKDK